MTEADVQAKATRRVHECVVSILVEPRFECISPYPYTGFVVDIEGRWFWFTAAHCARKISKDLATFPDAALALVSIADQQRVRVELPKDQWSFVDGQASVRAIVGAPFENAPSERDAELFDIAFWPVPSLMQCYLLERGVKPLTGEELFVDEGQAPYIPDDSVKGIFASGVPEVTHVPNVERGVLGAELKTFPLHPYPDEGIAEPRQMHQEGHFTWMPTCWNTDSWNASIVGVSGGPVLLVTNTYIGLLGIVTRQKPGKVNPDYVGICQAQGMLDMIRRIMLGEEAA